MEQVASRIWKKAPQEHEEDKLTNRAIHEETEIDFDKLSIGNWFLFAKVYSTLINVLRRKVENDFGLTLPQFDTLSQLFRNRRGMTFVELSKQLLVTSGNLTGIVDRLEASGYVRRAPGTKDRRSICVELTPQGWKFMEEIIPKMEAEILRLMDPLPKPDRIELRKILTILRNINR